MSNVKIYIFIDLYVYTSYTLLMKICDVTCDVTCKPNYNIAFVNPER